MPASLRTTPAGSRENRYICAINYKILAIMGKFYRLNVTICYSEDTNINQYRKPVLDIFKSFAWLYQLDYAISVNHDFGLENGAADLVYLRSTSRTEISKKELYNVICEVFHHRSSFLWRGVYVDRQMYKVLSDFPFPDEFYRPLQYPYVEFHRGNKAALFVSEESLSEVLNESDSK